MSPARCAAAVTAATANSVRATANGEPSYAHPIGDGCLRTATLVTPDGEVWCWQHGRNFNVRRTHGDAEAA